MTDSRQSKQPLNCRLPSYKYIMTLKFCGAHCLKLAAPERVEWRQWSDSDHWNTCAYESYYNAPRENYKKIQKRKGNAKIPETAHGVDRECKSGQPQKNPIQNSGKMQVVKLQSIEKATTISTLWYRNFLWAIDGSKRRRSHHLAQICSCLAKCVHILRGEGNKEVCGIN